MLNIGGWQKLGEIIDSIKPHILACLPYDRGNAAVTVALESQSVPDLLMTYLNWRNRLIAPRPRVILRSPQFDANPLWQTRPDELSLLVGEIEGGIDLTRRLSRSIKVGFTLPRKGKSKPLNPTNRPDLDMLLNDWRVHHLHISSIEERDGFVARSEHIVFGVFEPNRAYLIDIYDHKNWAARSVVETAYRAWPDANLFLELKGLTENSAADWSDEERLNLRNVGLVTTITIDGRIFAGAGVLTSAGTTVLIKREAGYILNTLHQFELNQATHAEEIRTRLNLQGIQLNGDLHFKFSFFANGFGVVETGSNTPIGLRP